jgi:hypothetical protein
MKVKSFCVAIVGKRRTYSKRIGKNVDINKKVVQLYVKTSVYMRKVEVVILHVKVKSISKTCACSCLYFSNVFVGIYVRWSL